MPRIGTRTTHLPKPLSAILADKRRTSYALPTVVNGMIYVPTSGISYSVPGNLLSAPSGTPSCQPSSPCGGILVFCTTHNSACNASNWQQP